MQQQSVASVNLSLLQGIGGAHHLGALIAPEAHEYSHVAVLGGWFGWFGRGGLIELIIWTVAKSQLDGADCTKGRKTCLYIKTYQNYKYHQVPCHVSCHVSCKASQHCRSMALVACRLQAFRSAKDRSAISSAERPSTSTTGY